MKKLTLVSFVVNGVRFARFVWLDARTPSIDPNDILPDIDRGVTVTIGG